MPQTYLSLHIRRNLSTTSKSLMIATARSRRFRSVNARFRWRMRTRTERDERDASVDARAAIRQNQQSGTPAESTRQPPCWLLWVTASTIIEPVRNAAPCHMCSVPSTTKQPALYRLSSRILTRRRCIEVVDSFALRTDSLLITWHTLNHVQYTRNIATGPAAAFCTLHWMRRRWNVFGSHSGTTPADGVGDECPTAEFRGKPLWKHGEKLPDAESYGHILLLD